MKYFKQFAIILVISFIGEILNKAIPLPIPASIYGLVLLFVALKSGVLPLNKVKATAEFLIEIMPLMFIPSAVGLLESWNVLQPLFGKVLVITVISTILVMVVTGRLTQFMIRRNPEVGEQKEQQKEQQRMEVNGK